MFPESSQPLENLPKVLRGIFVCPLARRRLFKEGRESLGVEGGGKTYGSLERRIPILVTDEVLALEYSKSSVEMDYGYIVAQLNKRDRWINRFRRNDYRTEESIRALAALLRGLNEDAVCVSIGGGPTRADARLLNLNIGPFPNVDIVADARVLPYADVSVDAIHCEAASSTCARPQSPQQSSSGC